VFIDELVVPPAPMSGGRRGSSEAAHPAHAAARETMPTGPQRRDLMDGDYLHRRSPVDLIAAVDVGNATET